MTPNFPERHGPVLLIPSAALPRGERPGNSRGVVQDTDGLIWTQSSLSGKISP